MDLVVFSLHVTLNHLGETWKPITHIPNDLIASVIIPQPVNGINLKVVTLHVISLLNAQYVYMFYLFFCRERDVNVRHGHKHWQSPFNTGKAVSSVQVLGARLFRGGHQYGPENC